MARRQQWDFDAPKGTTHRRIDLSNSDLEEVPKNWSFSIQITDLRNPKSEIKVGGHAAEAAGVCIGIAQCLEEVKKVFAEAGYPL